MVADRLDFCQIDLKEPLFPLPWVSLGATGSPLAVYLYLASAPIARSIAPPSFRVTTHLISHLPGPHSSFHHQTRKEWRGDLRDRRLLLVRSVRGDKFVFAVPAVPKILDFPRVDAFIPLKTD
jgi:hypothetical protein